MSVIVYPCFLGIILSDDQLTSRGSHIFATTATHRFKRQQRLPADSSAIIFPSDDDDFGTNIQRQEPMPPTMTPTTTTTKPWNQPFPLVLGQSLSSWRRDEQRRRHHQQLQEQRRRRQQRRRPHNQEFDENTNQFRQNRPSQDQQQQSSVQELSNWHFPQDESTESNIRWPSEQSFEGQQPSNNNLPSSSFDTTSQDNQQDQMDPNQQVITPEELRRYFLCMENCRTTNEYNPVCGNDGATYGNRAKLRCSRSCGNLGVEMQRMGTCRPRFG